MDLQKSSLDPYVIIGVTFATGLLAVLLLPLPAAFDREPVLRALENVAHGPLFACTTFLALRLLGHPTLRRYAAVAALACAVALGTEFLQGFVARDPAWSDVRTDVAGAAFGMAAWALRFDASATRPFAARAALIALAALGAFGVLSPAVRPIGAWLDRAERFPVLFDAGFADWASMTQSMSADEDVEMSTHEGALSVRFLAEANPGVWFTNFVADWRGYATLNIDIENPGEHDLPLDLHIRDWTADAFDAREVFFARRTLKPGERAIVHLPLRDLEQGTAGRRLRLNDMHIIAINRAGEGADELLVHSIALE